MCFNCAIKGNMHACMHACEYTDSFECGQAILPLRGKILNIERKDDAAIYKNQEIQNLILALGLGVKVHTVHLASVTFSITE